MQKYRCRICGNDFENKDGAKKCEKRGIVMFSRKTGDTVSFIKSEKNDSAGVWTYKTVEGVIVRVDLILPKTYPGHEYGIAATSYLVKEKNGKKSRQSSLLNDAMKIVTLEKV